MVNKDSHLAHIMVWSGAYSDGKIPLVSYSPERRYNQKYYKERYSREDTSPLVLEAKVTETLHANLDYVKAVIVKEWDIRYQLLSRVSDSVFYFFHCFVIFTASSPED